MSNNSEESQHPNPVPVESPILSAKVRGIFPTPDSAGAIHEAMNKAIAADLARFEAGPFGDLQMNAARAALVATGSAYRTGVAPMLAELREARQQLDMVRGMCAIIRDRLSGLNLASPFAPDVIHAMHVLAAEQAIPNGGYSKPVFAVGRVHHLADGSYRWTCVEHQEKGPRESKIGANAGLDRHLAEHHSVPALPGCEWGRKIGTWDSEKPCIRRAARTAVVRGYPGGEMSIMICEQHGEALTAETITHVALAETIPNIAGDGPVSNV